jgi:hypothetical protein
MIITTITILSIRRAVSLKELICSLRIAGKYPLYN